MLQSHATYLFTTIILARRILDFVHIAKVVFRNDHKSPGTTQIPDQLRDVNAMPRSLHPYRVSSPFRLRGGCGFFRDLPDSAETRCSFRLESARFGRLILPTYLLV